MITEDSDERIPRIELSMLTFGSSSIIMLRYKKLFFAKYSTQIL
ncbi:MAG TPA: hypothetical protein VGK47_02995 [Nitrososphaeraceae archaeon]